MSGKPNVLVLGGLGFIGRNLVEWLVDNNVAGVIRVADKVLPDLAGLNEKQLKLFKDNVVQFKQANLAREGRLFAAASSGDLECSDGQQGLRRGEV